MKARTVTFIACLWLGWSLLTLNTSVSASVSASVLAADAASSAQPLSLGRTPETLPIAVVGQRYGRDIHAEGGQKPLSFALISGPLPEG
ncbi:MAG: hypothetical protein AB3X37_09000, partial [Leptothrix ochracea]|uniref:hypothetical protein n=1 Tax=Leptothrix ochracea TaxID=735331 RepID=UPI0034E1DE90